MEKVSLIDIGRLDYQEAWDYQTKVHKEVIARKLRNRDHAKAGEPLEERKHYLIFCEHPPVYTLGKSGSLDHLLLNEQELKTQGFSFYKINRGGDITYHGPGQIVVYPIFDLDGFFTDVHKYVRCLEEAVMRTLEEYGVEARREEGYTGVWLDQTAVLPERKICAIGVHLSRWVTMHGLALNVNTNLRHFNHIVPCGIADDNKAVTSLEVELMKEVDITEVKSKLAAHFKTIFEFDFISGVDK